MSGNELAIIIEGDLEWEIKKQKTEIDNKINDVTKQLNISRETFIKQTNERMNEIVTDANQHNRNLMGLIDRMNESISFQAKEIRKLKKENKIFKSTFNFYADLFKNLHPILLSEVMDVLTRSDNFGNRNNKILFNAIRDKWSYIPSNFSSSSVSDYDGYSDSDV